MADSDGKDFIHQPNSLWSGYFAFQNMLGGDISSGTAEHWTTDWGKETVDLSGLTNGNQSLSQPFKTSTTDVDRWGFSVTMTDGTQYSLGEKDCGFENDDAGGTVILQATWANGSGTLQIIMPKSSNCSGSFS